jgi:ribosome-binding protein aMBF1 (putative translation factor)
MRTKTGKRSRRGAANGQTPLYRTVNGKSMVLLEVQEYERLKDKADEWEPLLPLPNTDGNYPAREYMLASIARTILRQRRRLGLSQAELARRAGIRPETLNRLEHAKHSPSAATVEKIERVLRKAGEEDTVLS